MALPGKHELAGTEGRLTKPPFRLSLSVQRVLRIRSHEQRLNGMRQGRFCPVPAVAGLESEQRLEWLLTMAISEHVTEARRSVAA
jgi:hypothetical protein